MRKPLFFCFIMLALSIYSNTSAQQTGEVELTNCSGDVKVLLKDTDEYTNAEEGIKGVPPDHLTQYSSGVVL